MAQYVVIQQRWTEEWARIPPQPCDTLQLQEALQAADPGPGTKF